MALSKNITLTGQSYFFASVGSQIPLGDSMSFDWTSVLTGGAGGALGITHEQWVYLLS